MTFVHRVSSALLRPVVCDSLRRLGSPHDGGYVVPLEAIERASVLLSFGLATNWSFERAAAALNPRLRIVAFDPSVGRRRFAELALRAAASVPLRLAALSPRGARSSMNRARAAVDYFRFFRGRHRHHEQRIWYNSDRHSAAIAEVIEHTGATAPLTLFAKIDIEGTEYRILPEMCVHAALFTGLAIEFHHTDICADIFNAQVTRLREHFEIVHVHGNNHADLSVDHALPLSLEVTFLNRRMFASTPVLYEGPLPRPGLDAPNDPKRADYIVRL